VSPWARIAQSFAGSFLNATGGQARALVDQLGQWGTLLTTNAAAKWLPRILDPRRCSVRGCRDTAVVPCVVCQCPTCLAHAFLQHDAEGICIDCVVEAAQARGAPGPAPAKKREPDPVAAALRVFKLDQDADWEDVIVEYRRLVQKHHPDKQKTDASRKKAEARMKKINGAYATLKRHFEEAA
jgi:hypothetical protein